MSILITGGTGSFGKTMLKHLLEKTDQEIRIFSRDEEKQYALRNEIGSRRVKFLIGDVRNIDSLEKAVKGVDKIFHAAALKQVPSCEFFPMEAVRTNILGSENVIRAGLAEGVKSIVFLSTDKAVFPINTMGLSKSLMEKLAQAAAREIGPNAKTIISCVRYGNVMLSRGSVIPLFVKQIKLGKPITITDPKMTRFLMPLSKSIELVNYAFNNAQQGDLFINKAPASSIEDLASSIKDIFGVPNHPIEIIGWRHGEKLYETLASAQELSNSEDNGKYLRIRMDTRELNYHHYFTESPNVIININDYNSHNIDLMSIDKIKSLLLSIEEFREYLN